MPRNKKPPDDELRMIADMPRIRGMFEKDAFIFLKALKTDASIPLDVFENIYGFVHRLRVVFASTTKTSEFVEFRDKYDKEAEEMFAELERRRNAGRAGQGI